MKFYSSTLERNTVTNHVAAPYIRKTFSIESFLEEYTLSIAVVGIYQLYVNGKNITKGYLSPYRSNPNHFVFVEKYDLKQHLKIGKNVITVLLGNGFSNSVYSVWDFDKASWIHSPKIALEVYKNNTLLFDASSFKTHPSEVVFDDFHSGEHIDNNKIIKDVHNIDYDDSFWDEMILVDSPLGELKKHPDVYTEVYETLYAKEYYKGNDYIIFDIGESCSFVYEIALKGEKGKRVMMFANDAIRKDNAIFLDNICCLGKNLPLEYQQFDWFILSGENDLFENRLTFKAGRFIQLSGLTNEEMDNIKIKIHKISSCSKVISSFECDNEVINKLQQCVINSDISNFIPYPTDCPHREKNGWTGDVFLSAEQFLLNLSCYEQLLHWVKHVVKAQDDNGALPGIVPTDKWGFEWGNGPGWDSVLFELPYRLYVYSGNKEPLYLVKDAIKKYLSYMKTKENSDGLFDYGLEDWVPIKTRTPSVISDTILCKNMCDLAYKILNILGETDAAREALKYSSHIKENYNKAYPLSLNKTYTQTQACMAIYFDIVDDKKLALDILLKTIKENNDTIDFGVIGNRAFWRVLAENGYIDLAIKLMTQDDKLSYKKIIDQGATTLFEKFINFDTTIFNLPMDLKDDAERSYNHHFWGDISAFFIRHLAGIQINNPFELTFAPSLSEQIKHIKCSYKDIEVELNYLNDKYEVILKLPTNYCSIIKLGNEYICSVNELVAGTNKFYIEKR